MNAIFEKAIENEPVSPDLYLIYADWLEENGYTEKEKLYRERANILSTHSVYAHKKEFSGQSKYVIAQPDNEKYYTISKDNVTWNELPGTSHFYLHFEEFVEEGFWKKLR